MEGFQKSLDVDVLMLMNIKPKISPYSILIMVEFPMYCVLKIVSAAWIALLSTSYIFVFMTCGYTAINHYIFGVGTISPISMELHLMSDRIENTA